MWGYNYGYPMMGYGEYGVLHAIFSIIWVFVLIAVIITAIRWMRGKPVWHGHGGHGRWCGNSALDILNERYAKGEINKQEFEEKRKDLEA